MNVAGIAVDARSPLFLIAGPCVIESESLVFSIAEKLKEITARLKIPLIFKASFQKANRSSVSGYRGPGIEVGLRILERVRHEFAVPVLTDVHEDTPLGEVAAVVDVLQTPALLCRQTNFIVQVASQGLPVNLKKGQFLAPIEMHSVVEKARSTGNENLLICERGTSFGYNNLVVDMRSIPILRATGFPVVFDASHSVQLPGSMGSQSGGERQFIPALAKAATAVGIAGLFLETHPDPENALCDAATVWPLHRMSELLEQITAIDRVVKEST